MPLPEHACRSADCVEGFFAFEPDQQETVQDVALHPTGDIVITGAYSGSSFQVGTMTVTNASDGSADTFVARIGVDGTVRWAQSLARPLVDIPSQIATAADGTIFVAGYADVSADTTMATANDAFVAAFEATGAPRWMTTFGDPETSSSNQPRHTVAALAATNEGGVVVMGTYPGSFNVGSVALPSSELMDSFVIRFSPDGSAVAGTALLRASIEDGAVWGSDIYGVAHALNGATFGDAAAVTTDRGEIVVFGAGMDTQPTWAHELVRATVDPLEDPELAVSPGGDRVVVVGKSPAGALLGYAYDPSGETAARPELPTGDRITVTDIALGAASQVTYVGYASGWLQFNGSRRTLSSMEAPFVTTFGMDGSERWSRYSDSTGTSSRIDDIDRKGSRIVVSGYVDGTFRFETSEIISGESWRYFFLVMDVGEEP